MNELRTRREFLYDFGALSFAISLSPGLVNKLFTSPDHLTSLRLDLDKYNEEPVAISYLGIGHSGMKVGKDLSAYLGICVQAEILEKEHWLPFSFSKGSWQATLDRHLEQQNMVVLVSDVSASMFFDVRQYVLSKTPCLWTICMVAENAQRRISKLHYAPSEIMRIVRGQSFPYQNQESFIQSILAIYTVQHKYSHGADFDSISMEAMDDLGLQ